MGTSYQTPDRTNLSGHCLLPGGVLSHHVVLPKKTAPLPSQRGRPQSRPLYSANGEAVDIFADIDSQGTHVENQLCES